MVQPRTYLPAFLRSQAFLQLFINLARDCWLRAFVQLWKSLIIMTLVFHDFVKQMENWQFQEASEFVPSFTGFLERIHCLGSLCYHTGRTWVKYHLPGSGGARSWLDKSWRCSSVMSRMAGIWNRRVNMCGDLGAKIFRRAMRQYSLASEASHRNSSLQKCKTELSFQHRRLIYAIGMEMFIELIFYLPMNLNICIIQSNQAICCSPPITSRWPF